MNWNWAGGLETFASAPCPECGRVFDLLDDADADEGTHGHDCEAVA